MRAAVFLIAFTLLAHPVAHALAATTDAPAGSLSGMDADDDRTMRGMVDAHTQEAISKWLRVNPHRDLKLHLDSGGGSARHGLMIYDAIGTHGRVATDVGPGQLCLSACSYIWLAGHTRTIADRAVLGFHSSYCTGPCDPRGMGLINQTILDVLARTEPALAVLISNTGAMIAGTHLMALARREDGHWVIRTFDPPTAVAQR